jgi:hypothetical protein
MPVPDRGECIRTAAGPAVVDITYSFETAAGEKSSVQGSGFIVKSDGHIITAAHVLRPDARKYKSAVIKSDISVKVGGYFVPPIPAALLTKQDDLDVALIKIPTIAKPWPTVQIDPFAGNGPHPWLYALGFPGQVDLTSEGPGRITSSNAVVDGKPTEWWQTNVSLKPGDSGGPIFNDQGEVVGIAGAIDGDSNGTLSYVIPISSAAMLIPIVGLTEYTPSLCADDPQPIVYKFIQDALRGDYDTTIVASPLMQTILAQTNGSKRYQVFNDLGPLVKLETLDKKAIPQGTWFTIRSIHSNGTAVWVIGYDRATKQIDSSTINPQISVPPTCKPAILRSFVVPGSRITDKDGNSLGEIKNVTASIFQDCTSTNAPKYHLHVNYSITNAYVKGNGIPATVSLLSENSVFKDMPILIDFDRCVGLTPEVRSADLDLDGNIAVLVSNIELHIEHAAYANRCD